MKKLFTLIFSLGVAGGAWAQTVSQDAAAQKAAALFRNAIAARSFGASVAKTEPELAYTSKLDGNICFYVFNNPQGGYAIIGGDEHSREVLAICDRGTFDINKVPQAMKCMLDMYSQDIVSAKKSGAAPKKVTSVGSADVAAICSTTWNQTEPFNRNCVTMTAQYAPKATSADRDSMTITGCVATAAAQCVYALPRRPATPRQDISCNHDFVDANDNVLGKGTFKQSYSKSFKIDWSNMLTDYDDDYNDTQAQAVADLMSIMGVISEMQYGRSSGALSTTLCRGLINGLGVQAKYVDRSSYSDTAWETLIYNELKAGRPVCYAGSSDAGGHQFVVDGYRKSGNLFHVNWGWGGQSDGYFALSSASKQSEGPGETSWLYPSQDNESSGASKEHYRDDNSAIINLAYDASNLPALVPAADADGASISSNEESARGVAKMEENIPTYFVDDEDCTLTVTFDGEGAVNVGEEAEFVWGIELEPVFADGEEPEEYDCYLLAVDKDGSDREKFEVGKKVKSYTIPLGEYAWSADGEDDEEGSTMKYGKYTVTPCLFYDADADDDYVNDEDIMYVGMPHSWKAPVALFTTTDDINTVKAEADAQAKSAKYLTKGHGVVIVKHNKKYNAAGQRL